MSNDAILPLLTTKTSATSLLKAGPTGGWSW